MIIHTNSMKVPVVVQRRKLLNGPNKGQIREVKIYCKYLDDAAKFRRRYKVINGPNEPSYEVVDFKLEVKNMEAIDKTYEEGVL